MMDLACEWNVNSYYQYLICREGFCVSLSVTLCGCVCGFGAIVDQEFTH